MQKPTNTYRPGISRLRLAACLLAILIALAAFGAAAAPTLARYITSGTSVNGAYGAEFNVTLSDFDVMLVNQNYTYEQVEGDVADISGEWSAQANFNLTPKTEVYSKVSIIVENVPEYIDVHVIDSQVEPTKEATITDSKLTYTYTFENVLTLDAPTQNETYPFSILFSLTDESKTIDVSAAEGAKIYARITQID